MAKTLFFLEALVFAALVAIFPVIAAESAAAFIAPAGLSLILPLACAMAVAPPREVFAAIRAAFSAKAPAPEAAAQARILDMLGAFSRAAAALGLFFAIACVCTKLPASTETWTLLGIYLSAYGLLNAMLWRILAAVVAADRRLVETASVDGCRESFAADHRLTPREWETASLIAEGRSYKEAACELGISIRTVKAHMSSVYEKTGAESNVGLALQIGRTDAPRPSGDSRPNTKVQ